MTSFLGSTINWPAVVTGGVAIVLAVIGFAWARYKSSKRQAAHVEAKVNLRLMTEGHDPELVAAHEAAVTARAAADASDAELAGLLERLEKRRDELSIEAARESAKKAGT